MTLMGAIKQLHELRCAEDMPIYYKPAIAEVINVLLMDTQEVRHGRWERVLTNYGYEHQCSHCHRTLPFNDDYEYCPRCGAWMDEVHEDE